jgi:hypothetical protein
LWEWILLLEIQTNCKNWVWKDKSVWALNVFTLGSTAQATLVPHEIFKKKPLVREWWMLSLHGSKLWWIFHYHHSLGDRIVWLLMTIMLISLWITNCPTPIKPPYVVVHKPYLYCW